MSLRSRVLSVIAVASIFGTTFLWLINIFYILRNWGLLTEGLLQFVLIVITLVVVSSIILWIMMGPIARAEKRFIENESLTPEEDKAASSVMSKMPLAISLVNVVGFFIGPVFKHISAALAEQTNPLSFTLFISIVYSVAIGVYIAFIEIRLVERIFQPIQVQRKRTSIDQTKKRKWSSRQFVLGFTIFTLSFGLFFSSGIGYLKEELLAPGYLDGLTAASDQFDARTDFWQRALDGENLNLTDSTPGISNRMWEYILKMGLLGLIVLALSFFAIAIETRPTASRMKELNKRLKVIAEGQANKEHKLVIIRGDEIGESIHWINRFIDHQADLMEAIGGSIHSMGEISTELGMVNFKAQELGKGLEEGIFKVQNNLKIQLEAIADVEAETGALGQNIIRTNDNLQNQTQAMDSNSAAVEELVANIGSVSKNAQGAFDRTQQLVDQAEKSSQEINHLLKGIQDIVETSDQVNQSVGQIARVAAQTNLLAMNAAIEAAHAGDVGAGFAVVAAEVRTLAEDSSSTTKKVTELIYRMNELSVKGLEQAHQAQQSFDDIRDNVRLNSDVISEISLAMQEQEGGSKEMQNVMDRLETVTKEVGTITKEQTAQSSHVTTSVIELNRAAEEIRGQMEQNISLIAEFEAFTNTLNEVIERNSGLVLNLESASSTS